MPCFIDEWYDNGDGSYTDGNGDIYDMETGEYYGSWINNTTWADSEGDLYDINNNPINVDAGNYYNGTAYAIPEGTYIDAASGDVVREVDGQVLGNVSGLDAAANEVGAGGGNVYLDPDQFGDVYTVNGYWMGNIYGLQEPGSANSSGRRPGNTPGAAYAGGGFLNTASSGITSAANIVRQLQNMLGTAQQSGASPSTVQALQAALNNAKAAAGLSTTEKIAIAGGALLALFALSQSRRAA